MNKPLEEIYKEFESWFDKIEGIPTKEEYKGWIKYAYLEGVNFQNSVPLIKTKSLNSSNS